MRARSFTTRATIATRPCELNNWIPLFSSHGQKRPTILSKETYYTVRIRYHEALLSFIKDDVIDGARVGATDPCPAHLGAHYPPGPPLARPAQSCHELS